MKTCSILCYYEGYDDKGNTLCNGNHTCDIKYEGYISASEYAKNTSEFLMSDSKSQYPTLSRIVLKSVTIFPSE